MLHVDKPLKYLQEIVLYNFRFNCKVPKDFTVKMEFAEIVREKLWHALETVAIILNS